VTQRPPEGYTAGSLTLGGTVRAAPERGYGVLRAIDPTTGDRKWEVRHPSPSWAGVLSMAGGVVFSGTNEGEFLAIDSRSGKELLRHQLGAPVYAAPITYMIENRQYVALAAGTTVTAFALPQR
jgi:alcohol dehydrogenase (cytochrome c)